MTFVRPRARILEISTTSGGGPLALAGAADGSYNNFASFMAVGDQTYVTIVEPGVAFWSGVATYSAANQLTLTTVEETKGTFGAGSKEVMASPLASTSMFREDIAGAIVTGGTSTAYTVASYRKYNTLAELDGNIIAFTPHVTNGLGSPHVSLNVDGLGAKALRAEPTRELYAGVLIAGTPYTARYDGTNGIFYLHGFFGDPYNVPLGAGLDYWGPTTPSSAFAFPTGQPISRATYAGLFALIGTTYGVGDGSTTFNLPDKTERVSVMKASAPSRLTSTYFGGNSSQLGAVGGAESHVLTTAEMPSHGHGVTDPGHSHLYFSPNNRDQKPSSGGSAPYIDTQQISTSGATTGISIQNTGGGGAHAIVQPTIVCNYIMRVF
ncbi:phage tail protein [Bradyrhizobium sp. P5_C12]